MRPMSGAATVPVDGGEGSSLAEAGLRGRCFCLLTGAKHSLLLSHTASTLALGLCGMSTPGGSTGSVSALTGCGLTLIKLSLQTLHL